MKKKILKLIKNEGGQALLLVIALLGVGGIMLAPMLSFMGDGLKAGQPYEVKADELYAADAGVEDAIWRIQTLCDDRMAIIEIEGQVVTLYGVPLYVITEDDEGNPLEDEDGEPYIIDSVNYDIAPVNGKNVNITIQWLPPGMAYQVISTATGADGSDTEIEAFVVTVYGDYTGITDFVITSQGDYDIDTGVVYPDGDYDPEDNPNGARSNYDGPWPTPIALMSYYSMFVDKNNPYDYDELDLDDEETIDEEFITVDGDVLTMGAAYIDSGDPFVISNSSGTERTVVLDGNLYITNRTNLDGKEWTLDLNGHSIFVESDVTGGGVSGTAVTIGSKVTLTGSGCIIAVGDIDFQPHMEANPEDYILVFSAIGETRMLPNGDFYGTLAGKVFVDVKSGSDPYIKWNDPDTDGDGIPDIDFPGGSSATVLYGLLSWKIS